MATNLLPIPNSSILRDGAPRWAAGHANIVATGCGEVPVIILADNWGEGDRVIVQFQRDDTDIDVVAGQVGTVSPLYLLHG